MTALVGQIGTAAARTILRTGNLELGLHGKYVHQRGQIFTRVPYWTGSLNFSGELRNPAPGITTNLVVGPPGNEFVISGKFGVNKQLALSS